MQSPSARAFREGLAAADAGNTERAIEIAENLLARDPRDVHAFQILGFAHFKRGRNHEAFEAFSEANRLAPNQPAIINWIGIVLKERGEFVRARAAFLKAAQLAPKNAEICCSLAEIQAILGERDEARIAYKRAAALDPNNALVLAKAARFFEQTDDIPRARICAEQALTFDPAHEIAHIAMAEIEIRERDFDAVITRLEPALSRGSVNFRNRSKMHQLLAEAYDKAGRYDEAFAAYSASNNLQKELGGDIVARERSPLTPGQVKQITEFLENEEPGAWTRFDNLSEPTPVFLLGFVRSGTTWLDQILSSHPDITVLEEEDNLFDAWSKFLLDINGMRRLATLTQDEIENFRRAYWQRAIANLRQKKRGKIFVDKVPLNTVQLALIYRLFPEAKIIFCVRDPRDCVFSAFQQHFSINAAMSQFLTLESAASYYDQVMTLAEICRRKFPLNVREVRYENLVRNLEAETRPLIEFLGLEWSDAILNYTETARKRAILTPSRNQVVNKPFSSSIGKWRRYEKFLAPVLPILDKWAAEYGYEVKAR